MNSSLYLSDEVMTMKWGGEKWLLCPWREISCLLLNVVCVSNDDFSLFFSSSLQRVRLCHSFRFRFVFNVQCEWERRKKYINSLAHSVCLFQLKTIDVEKIFFPIYWSDLKKKRANISHISWVAKGNRGKATNWYRKMLNYIK